MRNLFLFFIALLLLQNTSAQDLELQLSSKTLENRNVEISYKKNNPGNFTIGVKFDNLTNTFQSPESVFSVNGNSGVLITLNPTDKDKGINYSYQYRYIRGKLNPKLKENFCYILPYKAGEKVRVVEMGYVNEKYFGAEKQPDWKSYSIYTSQQDTVTAIRKGVVVEIVDKFDDKNPASVVYTSEKNYIIVEHEDGTLLKYSGFERGSITVQLGETVLPGSVLGINAPTQNFNYSISLLLYYLNSADFESLQGRTLSSPKSLYKILTPKFTFDGSTCDFIENKKEYTVFNNEEIIMREMSKKELKKYRASKGDK
ncbi:MAG: hypothetical protein ABI237_01255 [Ginsengibacter sp.]